MSVESSSQPSDCPLCRASRPPLFAQVRARAYFRCTDCGLIFLEPQSRPDPATEQAQYDTHDNDPADRRYRDFLDRLATPLQQRLKPGMRGLDYGAGPGPTLSVMLEERGFPMTLYDPYYAPQSRVLDDEYDFVTCTETAEHFFQPAREFDRLATLLKPGGWLGLMTMRRNPALPFADWHYIRDPTHVCFYDDVTLHWIADHYHWQLEIISKSVALFYKPP